MQRIAIINSRQALRPTGASQWLHATSAAIKTLATDSNYLFVTSLGEITYEMTLYHLIQAGVTIEIVLTDFQLKKYATDTENLQHYLASEFNLSPDQTQLTIVEDDNLRADNSSHTRDRAVLQKADVIVPVSIRQGGFWETQLSTNSQLSAKVDNRFSIPYQKHQTTIKKRYEERPICPQTALNLDSYLIHWTRSFNHQWLGEKRWEFYRDLVNAQESYPRSALSTLERILSEKLIRSSARHMPNSTSLVAMTSASLAESVALMKYRARYREMTIEPYAIAIPQELAIRIGARKVQYHSPIEMKTLSEKEKLFAHSSGSTNSIWEKEQEWRVLGDIDLKSVWNEIVVLTESQIQADEIEKVFRLKTLTVFA